MSKIFLYLFTITLFVSCSTNNKIDTLPEHFSQNPTIVILDTLNGYEVNSFTGDSIKPIQNSLGDTISTGSSYLILENNKIEELNPKKNKIGIPYETLVNNNRIKIKISPKEIYFNKDSLPITLLGEGDASFILSGLNGNVIETGVKILVKNVDENFNEPIQIIASPPLFKDNSINNIQYLDVDQGMATSYIYYTFQDSHGNLWFGTYNGGVSKYNGVSFTHYTTKEGLPSNYILVILEDKEGNLWFGTDGGGISKYNGENFVNYRDVDGLCSNTILALEEDSKGNIWVGTNNGLSMFNGDYFINYTTKEGLVSNNLLSLLVDKNDGLWIGTFGSGVDYFNGKSFVNYEIQKSPKNTDVRTIIQDRNDNIWFGSYGYGVFKLDGNKFTQYTKDEGLGNDNVLSMFEADNGDIWIGNYGFGITKFDGEYFSYFTEKEGLSNSYVMSMMQDNSGGIWVGTLGGGVSRLQDKSFSHYTEKEGLTNSNVNSIIENKNGELWFGTYGNGICKYDGRKFVHYSMEQGLSNSLVWSMVEDNGGDLWVGTYGGGVNKIDSDSITYFGLNEGLKNLGIRSMLEDSEGNLWFGTFGGGVSRYDGVSMTTFTVKQGMTSDYVLSIFEDSKGVMWFGTDAGGVVRYDGRSFKYITEKEGLSNNIVMSIIEDEVGNLWFGTYGGGVNIYDGKTITYYTEKEGLSDNFVLSLSQDQAHNVWAGTESGLSKFIINQDNKKVDRINCYEKNDGLKGLDFYSNSVLADSRNQMWWGSGKSLTKLDLNNYYESNSSPKVYLQSLGINEQFIDFRNMSDSLSEGLYFEEVKKYENYPINPELSYENNHLTFHFYALDWAAQHKIKYSYMLEGLNVNWSMPNRESKVDYRNLSHGNYVFKVRAIGQTGEWSEAFEYKFTINPPWWKTWVARIIYLALFVLLLYLFFKWRTNKLKQRQRELETEVNLATKEIVEQKVEVEKQKEIIEETHKEITDSINYAKRLQNAILPSFEEVNGYLLNNFILFKPKNVVSGDFYWFEHKSDLSLIAVADCTGYGVPGAMVSVVCSNAMNRAVNEFGIIKPAQVLDKTRELVIKTFAKSGEDVRDGMDIALCAFSKDKVIYSGANNPLWIVRKVNLLTSDELKSKSTIVINKLALIEFKPDRQPIGLYEGMKNFSQVEVELFDNDCLYLFTDGFADQFGGEKGKKFKYKQFKELLISLSEKPMNEQKKAIDTVFETWKGELEQIDDVCIVGVRV